MRAAAILAIFGFLTDLALHIASFVCLDPGDRIHPQWLGIALFYVLLGVVVLGAMVVESRRKKRAKLDGIVLPDENPPWFKPILWVFVAYAVFCFFMAAFVDGRKGDPVQLGPASYVADSGHGRAPVPISADEYHRMRRLSLRRGTGFFLMFYFAIAADLLLALTGQKRFKSAGSMRGFSFVFIRRS